MNQSNNYLANEKIGKLIMKFSIPCIMSLLVASLYNIVDQIFIGQGVGYLGNGATNVVFPITVIALSFSLLIGDGTAAYLSICQGKNDKESSNESVGNAITILFLISAIYVIILICCQDFLLNAFGATPNNISYAVEYYRIIIIGIPFFVFTNGLNSIIRADGKPQYAMKTTLVGAIINVILDPIAIFVLHWGMKGAALATIIGQIVSAILALLYMKKAISFKLDKTSFVLRWSILSKTLPLGISSFLTQISIVVTLGVMNKTLVHYGANSKYGPDIPLTVVGIVVKMFQIVIAFIVGIAAGAQPIVGYNYGAGHYHRVKEIYKKIIILECIIGAVSMIIFECFPKQIISVFGNESSLYVEYAVLAFRIYLFTIILCCVQKATSIFLQSLGKPVMSMTLSLLRDFVFCVPLVFILASKYGVVGILYWAPISDVLSMFFVVVFMVITIKQLNNKQESTLKNQ